jgi:protoheme ferro-lyase
MSIEEMMDELITKEEQKLGVNSLEFMQKHLEIMEDINRVFHQDLMMEEQEGV